MATKKYKTLKDFYPYYLTEHVDATCRTLHFIGTGLVISVLLFGLLSGFYKAFWLLPVVGYGFAWVGHGIFEKNKPATFTYPLFSLASDFIMFKDILTGQISTKLENAKQVIGSESK